MAVWWISPTEKKRTEPWAAEGGDSPSYLWVRLPIKSLSAPEREASRARTKSRCTLPERKTIWQSKSQKRKKTNPFSQSILPHYLGPLSHTDRLSTPMTTDMGKISDWETATKNAVRFQSLTVVHVASQVTTFTFDKQKSCRDKSKSKPVCRIKPLEIKASASLIVTIITITKREREKKKKIWRLKCLYSSTGEKSVQLKSLHMNNQMHHEFSLHCLSGMQLSLPHRDSEHKLTSVLSLKP